MARPHKPENERASVQLGPIRITKDQDFSYRAIADKCKIKRAAWVKRVLDAEVSKNSPC